MFRRDISGLCPRNNVHPCGNHCPKQRFHAFGLSLSSMAPVAHAVYKVEFIHKSELKQSERVWQGFADWMHFLTGKQAAAWVREHKRDGYKYRIYNVAKRDKRLHRVHIELARDRLPPRIASNE